MTEHSSYHTCRNPQVYNAIALFLLLLSLCATLLSRKKAENLLSLIGRQDGQRNPATYTHTEHGELEGGSGSAGAVLAHRFDERVDPCIFVHLSL